MSSRTAVTALGNSPTSMLRSLVATRAGLTGAPFTYSPAKSKGTMTEAGRLRLAIDLDGVLTEHPRPLAQAASARFGVEMPESAFVDSAGLNVPDEVRDWVYGPDGPASQLSPDPEAAEFLHKLLELVGPENVSII